MALRVRAGSPIRFGIRLANRETLAPIGQAPVFLDRIDAPAGPPIQVASSTTDPSGNATVSSSVPSAPGTYRFRARTPGVKDRFRADVSGDVSVEAVAV